MIIMTYIKVNNNKHFNQMISGIVLFLFVSGILEEMGNEGKSKSTRAEQQLKNSASWQASSLFYERGHDQKLLLRKFCKRWKAGLLWGQEQVYQYSYMHICSIVFHVLYLGRTHTAIQSIIHLLYSSIILHKHVYHILIEWLH